MAGYSSLDIVIKQHGKNQTNSAPSLDIPAVSLSGKADSSGFRSALFVLVLGLSDEHQATPTLHTEFVQHG